MHEKNVNEMIIRTKRTFILIFALLLVTTSGIFAFTPDTPFQKKEEGKPRISLGASIKGGICYSMIYTKDLYFDEKSLSYRYNPNAGLGLIADFPISRSLRIWLNPQVMMLDLKEPYLSTDLTLQAFLSKSFFITVGGIVSFEKFKNIGVGPTLGMGFKFAKIVSIYAQSEASYYNLPESGEFVKYRRIQAPISLGIRIDFISAFKKERSEAPVSTPPAEPPRQTPAKPIEEPKVDQQQAPVTPAEQPKMNPQPQAPAKPVEEPKVVLQSKVDLSKMSTDELNKLLQNAIKEEKFEEAGRIQDEINKRPPADLSKLSTDELNKFLQSEIKEERFNEASRIQDEINKRVPGAEFKGKSYTDLTTLLNKAVQSEDFAKAQNIQDEINLREASGVLNDIPVQRLEKMLQDAVKTEDYTRAAALQEEIKKRKK
jgi:protein-arginine kinase activator protein McsA